MSVDDSGHILSFSVVVELENAAQVDWPAVGEMARALARQIAEASPEGSPCRPQAIFAHASDDNESSAIRERLLREAPELFEAARVCLVGVPAGRYYELKNAGASQADGEIIVFLDSDVVPEPGWLSSLLAPLARRDVVASAGHTYLGHSGLVSRTLALVWVFPLRDHDSRAADRRTLSANNCAFRADWIRAHPFPVDNGFKVGCSKLVRQLEQSGETLHRTPAYAKHAPLSGWRFLLWRALVTGRDADRRYADMKSPLRRKRLLHALKVCGKMQLRAVRRVLAHYRHVAMPLWEVPFAVALGCAFYALAFLAQMKRLSGLTRDRCERVPAFAEHH